MALDALFRALRDKPRDFLGAETGENFEDRIMRFLRLRGSLTRIERADLPASAMASLADKRSRRFCEYPPNGNIGDCFVYQPRGPQNFPDLLVLENGAIMPVEIKFSKIGASPMWNSNVPRADAFYIFASRAVGEITFFCGDSLLTPQAREKLYGYFSQAAARDAAQNRELQKLDLHRRGFAVYTRSAFWQKTWTVGAEKAVKNYFAHPERAECEERAIRIAAGEIRPGD